MIIQNPVKINPMLYLSKQKLCCSQSGHVDGTNCCRICIRPDILKYFKSVIL